MATLSTCDTLVMVIENVRSSLLNIKEEALDTKINRNKLNGIITDHVSEILGMLDAISECNCVMSQPAASEIAHIEVSEPTSLTVSPDIVPTTTHQQNKNICRFYAQNRCKHTKSACKFSHPKKCPYIIENGVCKHPSTCDLYHPKLCWNSLQSGECYTERCRFTHLKGTIRSSRNSNNSNISNIQYSKIPNSSSIPFMQFPPPTTYEINKGNDTEVIFLERQIMNLKDQLHHFITDITAQLNHQLLPRRSYKDALLQ